MLVTGELREPGERAGWGRGRAAGGLGAGVRSGAAGGLVASGRAASGNGHAGEQDRHVRGLGKHWDTRDGETRWDAECVDEMSQSKRRGSTPTIYMGGVRAKASDMHRQLLSRANPQCLHTAHPALVPDIRATLGVERHSASLGPGEPRVCNLLFINRCMRPEGPWQRLAAAWRQRRL